MDLPRLYSSGPGKDEDFDDVDSADIEADFATYHEEVAQARVVAAKHDLDDRFVHPTTRREFDLRWVFIHMIEEYARHNGHADLLRERIDGEIGA